MRIGALEAGGTKMVCAVGTEQGKILERISIPTGQPENTMPEIIHYFSRAGIDALGVACFGPLDLNESSLTYGYITSTPKRSWRNYNILGRLKTELRIPIGFDTDVNGSVLGEAAWGALKGVKNGMYITIGTGIGAGIISNGKVLHGIQHPEAGHIMLRKHPEDIYEGICAYHGACFEGLASGPAIEARWGRKAQELAKETRVWELEAFYIGQALADYIMVLAPERIVLGGGVMHQTQLLPLIHREVAQQLGGYIQNPVFDCLETYIILSELGDDQGILGALRLGVEAAEVSAADKIQRMSEE